MHRQIKGEIQIAGADGAAQGGGQTRAELENQQAGKGIEALRHGLHARNRQPWSEQRDFFLSFAALDALGQIGDARVTARIVPLLDDELLREAAAILLGKIGDEHTVLPLSKFGLMQITRERVRPQMNIATKEVCPTCNGTGKINASILVTDQIENNIQYLFEKQNEKKLVLALHPFLYAYYSKGLISKRIKMYFKYKRWVEMIKDSSLGITEVHFLNKDGEEIDMGQKNEQTLIAEPAV